ncbi:MoxR family ATPase [Brevibacillus sp. HB1.2]|uniref:MoxR family ATPase n=1 Tax=Brevibacillus porteri TaxID=2126350 RepID=A0ABX5FR91_9BACL|nr:MULTISPECIES: MoxR family ATPase [Brevibacillus]ATF15581.1 MoxR family ATPase [Brevibacillus brevis X23]MDC0762287.1 MoxR family ATPase [Brevibacillus sp. AG]MED1799405.1 MoxR family ATPase [Brevibacillus porteri]MED2131879.1 MoxR family ATPase [Brevibacillus porteri]MED2742799.1 MoxR family ATPase [Brevibacillus porteri]
MAQQTLEDCLQRVELVRQEIGKVLVGQKDVVEQLLWAVFAGGHALLEGVPGLGKTLLVRTLSQAFELSFQRIQFTPDLMPTDITGTNILLVDEKGQQSFQFQHGPIFAHVVLADEINRATPKTQSALLEAMQERTVSAGGVTRQLPAPFFVLATQNPLEQEGTYPLPEAQMDRFLLKIDVPYPTEEELKMIVRQTTTSQVITVEKVASAEQIAEIQQAAREVLVADAVLDYAVKLLLATHPGEQAIASVNKYVRNGAGPRGVQAIVSLAKVRALLAGRYNLAYEDVTAVALPALRHRIFLNFEGEANGIRPDRVIMDILDELGTQKV